MSKSKILSYIVSIVICLPLLSTTCDDAIGFDILEIENKTDVPIIMVLMRDNLYPYWTHFSDALNNGSRVAAGESMMAFSERDREQYFARVSAVQVLVYDATDVGDDLVEFYKYASQNRCEMVQYLFTPKELEAMRWTITVTPDDVLDYQKNHGAEDEL